MIVARLQRLLEAGILRPIDLRLAALLAARDGGDAWIAGLSAALVSWRLGQGDVCVPLAAFAGQRLFPHVDDDDAPLRAPPLDAWRERLAACTRVGAPGSRQPLILDGDRLYLGRLHDAETRVAVSLTARLAARHPVDPERLGEGLERLFPGGDPVVVDWQRVAAAAATLRPFAVISGGPGTGKTTTVVRLLALLLEQQPSLRIRLAAPTGKAADRLASSVAARKAELPVAPALLAALPERAATLHRLLGADRHGGFAHHARRPLHADVVVVDEASMIDLPMMLRLLDALPPSARLILLGDRDQLASVDAGHVLGDLCGHGRHLGFSPARVAELEACGAVVPGALQADPRAGAMADAVVSLRVSHRFGADSGIGRLARAVLTAEGPFDPRPLLEGCDDVDWLELAPPAPSPAAIDWAAERYAPMLRAPDAAAALDAFARARVLCAVHQGEFGTARLNQRIERRLQQAGLLEPAPGHYAGRPLLVIANDHNQRLYNGDIGLVLDGDEGLAAWFPAADGGPPRRVALHALPPHETAFAMTVHKSQGSEFDDVLCLLPAEPVPLATRELLYTAITRARRRLTVATSAAAFGVAASRPVRRHSGLAARLGWPPPDDQDVAGGVG